MSSNMRKHVNAVFEQRCWDEVSWRRFSDNSERSFSTLIADWPACFQWNGDHCREDPVVWCQVGELLMPLFLRLCRWNGWTVIVSSYYLPLQIEPVSAGSKVLIAIHLLWGLTLFNALELVVVPWQVNEVHSPFLTPVDRRCGYFPVCFGSTFSLPLQLTLVFLHMMSFWWQSIIGRRSL